MFKNMSKKNFNLCPRIIGYKFFRHLNAPKLYPFNLTISVTNRCNSKCKTCNIWKSNQEENELGLEDWRKILKSIGKCPVWITISGGEPFLREDLVSIIKIINKYNRPSIINIATNGILTDKIYREVKEVLTFYKGKLIVNLSADGIKQKHDFIRGVRCFDKVLETYKKLKKIKNLTIGIHTVISKYNVRDVSEIYNFFEKLNPDSMIYEIAENRAELQNEKINIAPTNEEYLKVVDFLINKNRKAKRVSKITKLLRKKYYKLTKKMILNKKAILPCYAGIASAHINYNGNLWACCMKCETFGNLMKNNFRDLWFSEKANRIRARIKNEKCYCTLANASYSNIICNFRGYL